MRLIIENMECGGCARGVTRAIQKVDPAATVDADPARREVMLGSDQPLEKILASLEAAGFPARVEG